MIILDSLQIKKSTISCCVSGPFYSFLVSVEQILIFLCSLGKIALRFTKKKKSTISLDFVAGVGGGGVDLVEQALLLDLFIVIYELDFLFYALFQ